jgi:hypothetical protein
MRRITKKMMRDYLALWLLEYGDKSVEQSSVSILGFDIFIKCEDDGFIKDVTPDSEYLKFYQITDKGRYYVSMH